jgi:cathepsin L
VYVYQKLFFNALCWCNKSDVSPVTDVVSAVKDQGHCGSCWAFASTATIESYVALSTGMLFDLSTEQIAMCAPNPDACGGTGKCEGSTAELAFEYLTGAKGIYEEYQYPYISYYGESRVC